MQAVILCGGLGTRLREETEFKPKPMVEIGSRPVLWHIMRHYRTHGVRDFVLCLGYKGEMIRDYFLNYRHRNVDVAVNLSDGTVTVLDGEKIDWRVTLVETGDLTMTGARIRRARKFITGDRCFATYGDGVSNIDVTKLLAFHVAHGKMVTVTAVRPPSRFGELEVEGVNVRTFVEKPQTSAGWINGGFFVFETRMIRELPDGEDLVLERDVLEKLANERQLAVYQHPGFWQCMDTYREMQLLNELWASGAAPWKTW
jgi:glucose-1-phosphate cytidylyltransferase